MVCTGGFIISQYTRERPRLASEHPLREPDLAIAAKIDDESTKQNRWLMTDYGTQNELYVQIICAKTKG
jgi:hypothetical protein